MKNIMDFMQSINYAEKLKKQFGVSNSITQMLQSQEQWRSKVSALNMHEALLKSIGQNNRVYSNNFSSLDIANSFAIHPKLGIPTTALDLINSIGRQQSQLFSSFRNMTGSFNNNQFSKINSLQIALGSISGQLTAIAATQKKWNLLEDFEEITSEAVAINEKIIDKKGITVEDLEEIKNFFQRIEIKVDKIDTNANTTFWKIITLLSLFLALMGEVRNWIPKPEYATKKEVEDVVREQFLAFESKLKLQKEYRTTKRICKVMLKPKSKSMILTSLPIDFDVIVLQVHHKWIHISYIDPKDSLPQTGWIMKKYLSKPK